MALINLESIEKRLKLELEKLEVNKGINLLTYKRNRGVVILKTGDDHYTLIERGYREQTCTVNKENALKLLEGIISREFPRSRKVRLYHINDPKDVDKELKKL